jgi:hypothetical protein
MHPIQDLFLEGFWYVLQIDMHFICTPMWTKFYSCKKWVLHPHPSCGVRLDPEVHRCGDRCIRIVPPCLVWVEEATLKGRATVPHWTSLLGGLGLSLSSVCWETVGLPGGLNLLCLGQPHLGQMYHTCTDLTKSAPGLITPNLCFSSSGICGSHSSLRWVRVTKHRHTIFMLG